MTAVNTTGITTEKFPTAFRKCEETVTRNEKPITYVPAAASLSAKNLKTQFAQPALISNINTTPAVLGQKSLKISNYSPRSFFTFTVTVSS